MKNKSFPVSEPLKRLQRYQLTFLGFRTLQCDYIRFENDYQLPFPNTFVCRILTNYLKYESAKNSLGNMLNELEKVFSSKRSSNDAHRPKAYIPPGLTPNRFRITVVNDLAAQIKKLRIDRIPNYNRKRLVDYILQKYVELFFSERERVYCYDIYETITGNGDNVPEYPMRLRITSVNKETGEDEIYEVKPYRLEIDDNAFAYYLVGYARLYGENEEFQCRSFKLSRIKTCERICGRGLTAKEIQKIKECLGRFGAANVNEQDASPTIVRLTQKGYEETYLKRVVRQRPLPVKEPKRLESDGVVCYELTFDCSHNQILYYFFTFGAEAEIISPESLRKEFKDRYQKASKRYSDSTEVECGLPLEIH